MRRLRWGKDMFSIPQYKVLKSKTRSFLIVLTIWHCHCSGLGCSCGVGSIPGLGTSMSRGCGQKELFKSWFNFSASWKKCLYNIVFNNKSLAVFFFSVSGYYILTRIFFSYWSLEYIDYFRLAIYAKGWSKIYSSFFKVLT